MASVPLADKAGPPKAIDTPSLKRNATARFMSSAAVLLAGFVSLVITARWLGPAGKGTISTLVYIAQVCALGATLGVGDAAIVLAAGDRARLQQLIFAGLPVAALACLPAVAILGIAAVIAGWGNIAGTVLMAALLVPLRMLVLTLFNFQNALERLVRSSLISVAQAVVEALAIVMLIVVFNVSLTGVVFAALLGHVTSLLLLTKGLTQDGLSLKLKWSRRGVRDLLRMGVPITTAWIVIALALRFDLVIVYTITGEAAAGVYAVALTLGQLANYTSSALAHAAFPRLARLEAPDGWELIPRLARMSLTSALISALILVAVAPVLIPVLFGPAYSDAIGPTVLLTLAAVAWSELNVLTRSVAALGRPFVQLGAFTGYLVVMVGLDIVLIPMWGILGAGAASLVAGLSALVGFLVWYSNMLQSKPLRHLIPRAGDVLELVRFIRSVAPRVARALAHPRNAWSS